MIAFILFLAIITIGISLYMLKNIDKIKDVEKWDNSYASPEGEN